MHREMLMSNKHYLVFVPLVLAVIIILFSSVRRDWVCDWDRKWGNLNPLVLHGVIWVIMSLLLGFIGMKHPQDTHVTSLVGLIVALQLLFLYVVFCRYDLVMGGYVLALIAAIALILVFQGVSSMSRWLPAAGVVVLAAVASAHVHSIHD